MAPRGAYWPTDSGCLTERSVDMEGHGRPVKVLLYMRQTRPSFPFGIFTLKVVLSRRRSVSRKFVGTVAASIVSADNVDGRPGVELFVHEQHISTDETVGVYSYVSGALRRVLTVYAGGGDQESKFSYACTVVNGAPAIVQSEYQKAEDGSWTRTDTVNYWSSGLINPGQPEPAVPVAPPSRSQIGGFC
jgi:hypothetical protein